jgi:antitoxin component of RelBE/YafQ-DinJ toxin-antitoxin module
MKMARDVRTIILTDEKIKNRIIEMVEQMGMTLSGLGSYVVGNFVHQQDNTMKPMMGLPRSTRL